MNTLNGILAILVMGSITFAQKYVPFTALSRISGNRGVRYLGVKLPAAVMLLLSLYTLQESAQNGSTVFFASCVAAVATALVHIYFRKPLLSILVGVVVYGLLK